MQRSEKPTLRKLRLAQAESELARTSIPKKSADATTKCKLDPWMSFVSTTVI